MRSSILALLLLVAIALGQQVLTRDTTGNRNLKLVGARTILYESGPLFAAVFCEENAITNALVCRFPPHGRTTHETTLIRIIECSLDYQSSPTGEWQKASNEVIFSAPTNYVNLSPRYFPEPVLGYKVKGFETDFSRWYLVEWRPKPAR